MKIYDFLLFILLVAPFSVVNSQNVISAEIVLKEGDNLAGSTVSNLNNPVTNEAGWVGFTFELSNGIKGMWYDSSIAYLSSNNPSLYSIDIDSGIGDSTRFILNTVEGSILNQIDAIYDHNGLVVREGTHPIGFPPNSSIRLLSRPAMFGSDAAYWIAGVGLNGSSWVNAWGLYHKSGNNAPNLLYSTETLIIDSFSVYQIGYNYCVSDDANHIIFEAVLNTGSSINNEVIVLNGTTIVARASYPTNIVGQNWKYFDLVCINNNGDYLFSGRTDGASSEDTYIAFNGNIVIQEGDTLDGIPLVGMSVKNISINDYGKIGFVLQISGTEHFFESDINDIAGHSKVLLSVGDLLDTDSDGTEDYELENFNGFFSHSLDYSEQDYVFLEVDISAIGSSQQKEAIVKFPLNLSCPNLMILQNGIDDINSSAPIYIEAGNVMASNKISGTSNVGYDASAEISLLPGFEVTVGALFEARIDGCGNLSGPIN